MFPPRTFPILSIRERKVGKKAWAIQRQLNMWLRSLRNKPGEKGQRQPLATTWRKHICPTHRSTHTQLFRSSRGLYIRRTEINKIFIGFYPSTFPWKVTTRPLFFFPNKSEEESQLFVSLKSFFQGEEKKMKLTWLSVTVGAGLISLALPVTFGILEDDGRNIGAQPRASRTVLRIPGPYHLTE